MMKKEIGSLKVIRRNLLELVVVYQCKFTFAVMTVCTKNNNKKGIELTEKDTC